MNKFKIGDKVYFPPRSTKVLTIRRNGSSEYPILVLVDSERHPWTLTIDGKLYVDDVLPSLFHATPENKAKLEDFYGTPFEPAYKNDNLSFGQAVELLKQGKKVARKGWNGKGMYLLLATEIDFVTKADLSDMQNEEGELTLPAIAMKTADNKFVVGWLASQTDMLAEDWIIV